MKLKITDCLFPYFSSNESLIIAFTKKWMNQYLDRSFKILFFKQKLITMENDLHYQSNVRIKYDRVRYL